MNHTTTTKTNAFKIGETYWCRSACDYDCKFEFTIIARTPKRMTVEDGYGKAKVVGVKVDEDGVEWALPMGNYSMAPVIRADRDFEN
jgi:hypothetical protein